MFLNRDILQNKSICAVKGQAFSLLGRLEGLGAGASAAQARVGGVKPPSRRTFGGDNARRMLYVYVRVETY